MGLFVITAAYSKPLEHIRSSLAVAQKDDSTPLCGFFFFFFTHISPKLEQPASQPLCFLLLLTPALGMLEKLYQVSLF